MITIDSEYSNTYISKIEKQLNGFYSVYFKNNTDLQVEAVCESHAIHRCRIHNLHNIKSKKDI